MTRRRVAAGCGTALLVLSVGMSPAAARQVPDDVPAGAATVASTTEVLDLVVTAPVGPPASIVRAGSMAPGQWRAELSEQRDAAMAAGVQVPLPTMDVSAAWAAWESGDASRGQVRAELAELAADPQIGERSSARLRAHPGAAYEPGRSDGDK